MSIQLMLDTRLLSNRQNTPRIHIERWSGSGYKLRKIDNEEETIRKRLHQIIVNCKTSSMLFYKGFRPTN